MEKAKEEACRELERIASEDTLHLIKEKQYLQTALECKKKQIDGIIKKREEGGKEIKLAADTEELGMIMVKVPKRAQIRQPRPSSRRSPSQRKARQNASYRVVRKEGHHVLRHIPI